MNQKLCEMNMYHSKNLNIASLFMLIFPILFLGNAALEGLATPIFLFICMLMLGMIFIFIFSMKNDFLFKVKIFVFFFGTYLTYMLIQHHLKFNIFPELPKYTYYDEIAFYHFSNLALPYINGEKNFIQLFTDWHLPLHDLPLHTVFSGSITYLSVIIDGVNSILVQKLLSPFLGALLMVVLYATIQQQFQDKKFAVKATLVYGLLSAVFMYSTPMLRDIDVALAYMLSFYLFLQPNSYKNVFFLFLIAFFTIYLRVESGMLLYGITLLYIYLYVNKLQSKSVKFIFYILVIILFSIISLVMYHEILRMIVNINEGYTNLSISESSKSSISMAFNKLPFGTGYIAKVIFSQMQPFPFFSAIDRPLDAISGFFWPFIFTMMLYAMIENNIRKYVDIKLKLLLVVSIVVLFIMSSSALVRRMMSVYPIIYIVSLYALYKLPNQFIRRYFYYYLFAIITLNTIYYFMKV